MNFKFYPLRALLLTLLLFGFKARTQAQLVFTKEVKNFTTGGDGTTANAGDVLIYTITITNTGTQNYIAAKLYDNIPPGVMYISGSTTLNGSTVADKIINTVPTMPYTGTGGAANTPLYAPGILNPGGTAVIKFRVTVTGNGGSIFNNATIDATQGNVSTIQATNTVVTNIIKDAGCNIVYQMSTSDVNPNLGYGNNYTFLRTVDTTNGKGGPILYDGWNGTQQEALSPFNFVANPGDNTDPDQFLTHSAAIAYDKSRQRIYFVNNVVGAYLSYIDMSGPTPIAKRYKNNLYKLDNNTSINRMGMGSDGYCYALTNTADDLIKFTFDASDKPVITRMGPLINAPTNTTNVLGEVGGDLFADGSGKMYLICNSGNMYKINPSTKVTTFMGAIKINGLPAPQPPAANAFTPQSLAIDLFGNVYINGKLNQVLKLNLQTMNAVPLNATASGVYTSGDYTTCAFPVLSSSIIADKTFSDIDGDGIINGGDTVEYKITVTNIGNVNAAGVYMYDYIPPSTTYIAGTTKMNGVSVPDIGGVMPFAVTGNPSGRLVNTAGQAAGIILPTVPNSAVVTFRVKTEPNKQVCNQSRVTLLDADGNVMFVNSSDPGNIGQTPTCFFTDGILPLMNLKFKGSLQDNKSVLQWTMNGDENVAAYEVEFSDNGTSFSTTGKVAGKGNAYVANSYQFTDVEHTFNTIRYYRLKVVQKGGSINYSGVIRLDANDLEVEAVPNPFDRDINIQIRIKTAEQIRIRLVDFSGREVYNTTEQLGIGTHSLSVRIPAGLSKGMYMLDVRAGSEQLLQKKLLKK